MTILRTLSLPAPERVSPSGSLARSVIVYVPLCVDFGTLNETVTVLMLSPNGV